MSTAVRSRALAMLLLVTIPWWCARGLAQPVSKVENASQVERARRLFESGGEHALAGDWQQAARDYEASLALLPRSKTRLNLATALQRLGRNPECLRMLDAFESSSDPVDDADLLSLAHELRALARARVATVQLRVRPASASVRVDGESTAGTGADRTLYLSSGAHEIVAEAANHAPQRRALDAAQGRTYRLSLQLPPAPLSGPDEDARPRRRAAPWTLLAAGLAAVAGAAVTGPLARKADGRVIEGCAGMDPCEALELQDDQARAHRLGVATDVLWTTGAALAGVGAGWLVWDIRRGGRPASGKLGLYPNVAVRGAGARLELRY